MNEIRNEDTLQLAGQRILVTRAVHQVGKLSDGLKALGAEPVEVPVLEIRAPDSYEPLDKAIAKLEPPQPFDWLILTSVNTVQTVVARRRSLIFVLRLESLAGLYSPLIQRTRWQRNNVNPNITKSETFVLIDKNCARE